MDHRLVAWAAAVKSRRRRRGTATGSPKLRAQLVPLWLFTDAARLADPCAVAGGLPRHLAGVIYRDDGRADRLAVGLKLAAICRSRHLAMVVAGDWRLARRLGAGLHLRGGVRPVGTPRRWSLLTSSAHGASELVRARRAGARLIFLSPLWVTSSHPGAAPLGQVRWSLLACRPRHGVKIGALGGVGSKKVAGLPPAADAVAGIEWAGAPERA